MPLGQGLGPPPPFRADDPTSEFKVTQYMEKLIRMARGLSFLDADGGVASGRKALNLDAVWVRYVSNGVANTEDTVAHNLGRIPTGIWVSIPDKAAVVYRGTTTWTSTQIFLKADVATVTTDLLLF